MHYICRKTLGTIPCCDACEKTVTLKTQSVASFQDGQKPIDRVYRSIMWRIMPFLGVCYVAAFINRSNLGFARLEFMRQLGFNEAVYGFGAGVFYVGYVLCEVPSNLYLAKSGVRKTLLRIMVLWGLCSAAMAFMKTANEFYVLRALLGAAEAGLFPGVLLYLTFWVPSARRAQFTAVFMFSVAVSGIVGGPLSGAIMHWLAGVYGLKGWQWLFLVDGLPSCLLGIMAYYFLCDHPSQAAWLSESDKSILLADLAKDQKQKTNETHGSFGPALRDPRFCLLLVMAYALYASTTGVFLWLPTIIRNSGIKNVWTVGLLSSIPFLIAAAAQFAVARHSDKSLERRWHTVCPALLAAIGWALLPFVATNPFLSTAILTLTTAGTLAAMVPFWTMPSGILSGTAAAAGIALVSTVGAVGSLLSPMLVGWIANRTGSLVAGQYYFAAVMFFGAIAVLSIRGRDNYVGAPAMERV
jgi:MFS family permease